MLEGEATQESTALEGAQEPAADAVQDPTDASAPPPEGEPESGPAEAAPEPESHPAPTLDWAHLRGFQSVEPPAADRAEREDYSQELLKELAARAARFARSVDDSIVLSSDGVLRWLGDPVARIVSGEDLLRPRALLLADEALAGEDRAQVETRLGLWLTAHIRKVLGPLMALAEGADLPDAGRVVAAKIADALGVLERERVRTEVRTLDQSARGALRKLGVRFGSLYIYVPLLLKPAARGLSTLLWTLRRGSEPGADRLLAFAAAGRTSFANEGLLSPDAYRVAGFRLCGERVVRVDIIERLSDLIRAAIPDHMRAGSRPPAETNGFLISPQMTSLTGCSGEAFASILHSLGFEPAKVSKAAYEAANRKAPTEPIKPAGGEAEAMTPTAEAAPSDDAEALAAPNEEAELPGGDEAEAALSEETPEVLEAASRPEAETPAPVEESAEAPVTVAEPELAAQDEASAEPPATGDPLAEEAAPVLEAADPAAEEEVEIWRPAPRRPRAPHRPHGAEHEARPAHGKPHRRHGRHSRDDKPAEAAATEASPAAEARPQEQRPPRRDEGPRRSEGRSGQERVREERRPQKEFAPRREPRATPVDPDSPFAKLAALKPLLERRDKRP